MQNNRTDKQVSIDYAETETSILLHFLSYLGWKAGRKLWVVIGCVI